VFGITVYFFFNSFFSISLAFSFVFLCTTCTILILNKQINKCQQTAMQHSVEFMAAVKEELKSNDSYVIGPSTKRTKKVHN